MNNNEIQNASRFQETRKHNLHCKRASTPYDNKTSQSTITCMWMHWSISTITCVFEVAILLWISQIESGVKYNIEYSIYTLWFYQTTYTLKHQVHL